MINLKYTTHGAVLDRMKKAKTACGEIKRRAFAYQEIEIKTRPGFRIAAGGSMIRYGLTTIQTTEQQDWIMRRFVTNCAYLMT